MGSVKMDRTSICALLAIMGGSIFGYVLIGISSAALTIWRCYYGLAARNEENQWWIGALFAVINVGGLPYGLVAGNVMEAFGRKKTVTMGGAVIFVGTLLSSVAPVYTAQACARVLTGVGVGMIMSSVPVYIAEMAPANRRGTLQALFQVCVTLQILSGNVAGYYILGPHRDLLPCDYCPKHTGTDIVFKNAILLAPGMVLALCVCIVGATIMPESEAWSGYVAPEGEKEEDDVDEGSALTGNRKVDYGEMGNQPKSPADAVPEIPRSLLGLLKCPQSLMAAYMMAVAQQATGINAVMFYAPKFLALGGVQLKMLGSVAVMFWNFVTTLLAMFLVDKVGRRTLLLPSMFAMAISLLSMGPIYAGIHAGYVSSIWCFVPLFVFVTGFEVGPGTLFGVILNEVFPEQVLPFGAPIVGTSSGIFALITTVIFPPLELRLGTGVFGIFGVITTIVWVYLLICLPETRGLTRREVTQKVTGPSWGHFGDKGKE
jgi:SP family arabinose:H+ symporter-like MFS transporter